MVFPVVQVNEVQMPGPTYLHSHSLVSPQGLSQVLSQVLSHTSTISCGMGQPLAPGAGHKTLWQLLYPIVPPSPSSCSTFASFLFILIAITPFLCLFFFFLFLGLIFSV